VLTTSNTGWGAVHNQAKTLSKAVLRSCDESIDLARAPAVAQLGQAINCCYSRCQCEPTE
jgi:hypothetical protein